MSGKHALGAGRTVCQLRLYSTHSYPLFSCYYTATTPGYTTISKRLTRLGTGRIETENRPGRSGPTLAGVASSIYAGWRAGESMGKHARLLQSLESQAQPLRWKLLDCLAHEYAERMSGIRSIGSALLAHLEHHEDEVLRSDHIEATGMRIAYWDSVAPYVNEWAKGLGFLSTDQVTSEFRDWLAKAAVQCSIHPLAGSDPARAVIETARVDDKFFDSSYEDLPDDPCPVPPEYDPDALTGPEYLEIAKQYMGEVEGWYERHNAVRALKRDPQTVKTHLLWIAWGLVEGLADEAVQKRSEEREQFIAGGDFGKVAALWRPDGLATLLGLRRNQKSSF